MIMPKHVRPIDLADLGRDCYAAPPHALPGAADQVFVIGRECIVIPVSSRNLTFDPEAAVYGNP